MRCQNINVTARKLFLSSFVDVNALALMNVEHVLTSSEFQSYIKYLYFLSLELRLLREHGNKTAFFLQWEPYSGYLYIELSRRS